LKGFRVFVVDGAAHTQKDGVESNGGSLEGAVGARGSNQGVGRRGD